MYDRSLYENLAARLNEAGSRGLERHPTLFDHAGEGPVVHIGGHPYLNFTSNDSLGQACSPEWRRIVGECFAACPPSASASRLAGGRTRITEEAEQAAAAYFGYAECLFLPSGYQGNLACITALVQPGQPVFPDRRVHASIAHALPPGKGDIRAYSHADYAHLERRLKGLQSGMQPLVITESLFSMDGTTLDLPRIAGLKERHGFFLMVDEAHAVGALGPGGRGLCATLPGTADIMLGTFGKALGLFGSFVLLPKGFTSLFEYLSSPVMHSTAMPPAHAAAVLRLLERLPHLENQRQQLRENASFFRTLLGRAGIPTRGTAHIVAVPTGTEARTAQLGARLAEKGILTLPARYPTVPLGDGLLRFGITCLHSREMLIHTARILADCFH